MVRHWQSVYLPISAKERFPRSMQHDGQPVLPLFARLCTAADVARILLMEDHFGIWQVRGPLLVVDWLQRAHVAGFTWAAWDPWVEGSTVYHEGLAPIAYLIEACFAWDFQHRQSQGGSTGQAFPIGAYAKVFAVDWTLTQQVESSDLLECRAPGRLDFCAWLEPTADSRARPTPITIDSSPG